jgi:hypothetical protein
VNFGDVGGDAETGDLAGADGELLGYDVAGQVSPAGDAQQCDEA